ncbi:MAG TPA: family 16 glycosylhydrolase [Verrucomicrobiae bacterium]|nr:family 16 glycosylhydrolase [Verrucomicrobiae bacterium]
MTSLKIPRAPRALSFHRQFLFLSAFATVLSLLPARGQNILANAGFEAGTLTGWSTFGPNNYAQLGVSAAHGGSYYYKVYGQFNAANNYTGIYQDNASGPGVTYSADGWAYSLSSDGGGIHGQDMVWLEVTFRDQSYNALALYRSAVVTGANIASYGGLNTWFDLQITNQCSFTNSSALILFPGAVTNTVTNLVAPAGTVYVRYQTVFAQGPDNVNGSMYFDDLTLNQTGGTVVTPPVTQWNIVWNDEFDGSSIDPHKWTFETGNNNGWGNQELEYYTGSSQNAYVSNGLLHIVARQQAMGGFNYTSARMKTQGLYTKTYGHVEWRAALPSGTGMWPALWMLGANIPSVGWPGCGEIDVVEINGSSPNKVQSSLHSGSDETGIYFFPSGDSATNFHTYLLDWEPNSISFSVDGHLFETQSSWSSSLGPYPAPFNLPEFLLMNLAVGGTYVGKPTTNAINAGTIFPAEMLVDYVRVYDQTGPLVISAARQPDGSIQLTWPQNIVCHLQQLTDPAGLGSSNWSDVPGATNPFVFFPDPTQTASFYRLASP